MKKLKYRYRSQFGATLLEMALVVSLIAVVGMANVTLFGDKVSEKICISTGKIESDLTQNSTLLHQRHWASDTNECLLNNDYQHCPPGTTRTHMADGGTVCMPIPVNW